MFYIPQQSPNYAMIYCEEVTRRRYYDDGLDFRFIPNSTIRAYVLKHRAEFQSHGNAQSTITYQEQYKKRKQTGQGDISEYHINPRWSFSISPTSSNILRGRNNYFLRWRSITIQEVVCQDVLPLVPAWFGSKFDHHAYYKISRGPTLSSDFNFTLYRIKPFCT